MRGAKKPVSSSTLKKISKLPLSQQEEASSLLVSGEIQTIDEYTARQQASEADSEVATDHPAEDVPAKNLSQEQVAVIMGMAYLADGVNGPVREFLQKEDTFSTLSRDYIRHIMKMLSSMEQSLHRLGKMLVDCY